jgi:hypothetical protein
LEALNFPISASVQARVPEEQFSICERVYDILKRMEDLEDVSLGDLKWVHDAFIALAPAFHGPGQHHFFDCEFIHA